MTQESTQPTAPPPLAAWWGHTGLLYAGLSVLAAVVGSTVSLLAWDHSLPKRMPTLSEYVVQYVMDASICGAAIAFVQWFILRRLVLRALRMAVRRDLSQTERCLVRDTGLWIVVTIAGYVIGDALFALIYGLLVVYSTWVFYGLPGYFLHGLIGGPILCTAQWLMLRRQVPGAGRWMRWTFGGVVLGILAKEIIWDALIVTPYPRWVAQSTALAVYAVIYATLQAVCMRLLAPGWMKRVHDAARAAPSDATRFPPRSPR